MKLMELQVGKVYKTRLGRLVKITMHDPNWCGGMFWGTSIDKKRPKLDHERFTPDCRWWSYLSVFAVAGGQILRNPDLDLVDEGYN